MIGAMLDAFAPDLWIAKGPAVPFMRIPYPTRMAVIRLEDGGLWVWSPIALDGALAAEVDGLGPVRHLVAPNKIHHLSLTEWVKRYPEARLHGAPRLAAKRSDLCFHTELGDEPDPAWRGQVDQVVFRGSLFMDEVVFFHRASCTALVTDLVQRFDPASLSGWRLWLMRAWGLVGPEGSTPREWRASFWNRRAGRTAKATALGWKPERLVIAHGACAREEGAAVLDRGLHWL